MLAGAYAQAIFAAPWARNLFLMLAGPGWALMMIVLARMERGLKGHPRIKGVPDPMTDHPMPTGRPEAAD
jgi:hypothetical protein